tara:strand:+ start:20658 stop:21575 length:918 start_codon:yes stop_codon:yes gene_type:complete
MLWTEKYRPKSMTEIIGQEKFVRDARSWVVNNDMPNILLFGVAGTGKTAAAGALANDLLGDEKEENFFEINASDDRKLETVRTLIKEIASSSKIGDIPFRIILLDEMDGMTKDAQNALKRIMERYEANCRFIITCNERHRIIYPLQSRCANYNFTRLSDLNMETMLTNILDRENITHIELDELRRFISGLHGDMRRGVTELQAAVHSGSPLAEQLVKSLTSYNEIITEIENKQFQSALDKVHKMIYETSDMTQICVNLHDVVLNSEMEHDNKFKFLRIIGESEWRSRTMTPKILASWMIGQMVVR